MAKPPETSRVFWHLDRALALHRLQLHRRTAPLGMFGGQMPLLTFVRHHPGCTQRDIAQALGVSTPAVATSIKRMQKAGLLEKLADEADMRCNKISLTEQGQQVILDGQRIFDEVTAGMFEGITEGELQTLEKALARMEQNLGGEEFRGKDFFAILNAARPMPLAEDAPMGAPGSCLDGLAEQNDAPAKNDPDKRSEET